MIYSNRKYPFDLFITFHSFEATSQYKNHLIIYIKDKIFHIGRLMTHSKDNMYIIQTMWNISETIEYISADSITHISILPYL